MSTWLFVLVAMGFAMAQVVAAMGELLPDVPLKRRWYATAYLFGAFGAVVTAYGFGGAA